MRIDVYSTRSVRPGHLYFAIPVMDLNLNIDNIFNRPSQESELVYVEDSGVDRDLSIYSFAQFGRHSWNTDKTLMRGATREEDGITHRLNTRESLSALLMYAFIGPIAPGSMNAFFNGDIDESPITGQRILDRFEEDEFVVSSGYIDFEAAQETQETWEDVF